MGSRERRARELAETRSRILDVARAMFVEHGYEATTMRAVADRMEYTPTALYHHFPSKAALLTELSAEDFRALAAAFKRIGRIDDPIERLVRIGRAYVDFALEHPMQYQLMFLARRPRGADEKRMISRGNPSEDAYAFLRETCADVIASGRLKAEFTDADELGQMVWAALHGLLALHIVKSHEDEGIAWRDARETASKICEIMIRGMLRTGDV